MDKQDQIISLLKEQNKRLNTIQKLLVSSITCAIEVKALDKWNNNNRQIINKHS